MFKNTIAKLLLITLLVYSPTSFSSKTLSSLESFEWSNRIILIRENSDCKKTVARLKQAKVDLDERHIFWFVLCKKKHLISNFTGVISTKLSNRVTEKHFANKKHNIVLIGKDGGIKYRAQKFKLNEINTLIDSMPMRQIEMREN